MARRTLSIRVEVVVDVDTEAELADARESLARCARRAIEDSPWHLDTIHAGSVLRRPHSSDGQLR